MVDLPVPTADPEQVRRIAEAVLSRPEFLQARPSWWRQGLRYVVDWFARLLETLGGGRRGSTIATIVLVVLAIVAAVVTVFFTRTVRRDPRRDIAVEGGVGRTPQDWLDDARTRAAAGEWRDALRCRYRAVVAALAADGLIEEVPGRTTGEYLAAVSADIPTAAEPFAVVTRSFESAWYGDVAVTAADVDAFAASASDVLAAAGVRRPDAVAAR